MEESIEELIERATEDPVEFVGAYLGIKGIAQSLQAENKRLREYVNYIYEHSKCRCSYTFKPDCYHCKAEELLKESE